MRLNSKQGKQSGSAILEALIAILIFSVGILALVGMQAAAIGNVSDAKYRADASFFADQIIGQMWADRAASATATGGSVLGPNTSYACSPCVTNGVAVGGNSQTQAWAGASGVSGALPQATAVIDINAASQAVTVTLGWTPPKGTTHKHVAVAFIN
jgi:type IV pilus assembly protein PilV